MSRTVAIVSKPAKPELFQIAPQLIEWFRSRNYRVILDSVTAMYVAADNPVERTQIANHNPNFVIVLGGDGTLLSAARAVSHADVPILGVNLGSLGFLTEIPVAELYTTLQSVDNGDFSTESRSMLHVELMRDGESMASLEALNDAVINKTALARLVDFDLYIDKTFVSGYKADGVIISTPTGSTAYSLAAGGPILMPSVDGFVIAPVCPHSLTHRPLVVRDSLEVEVVIRNVAEEAFLSIDGQVGMPVLTGDRLVCRKSLHRVKLIRMRKTFFEILRTRLAWGQR
jgi:NAD+ kinase